jgi:hypothetical protein
MRGGIKAEGTRTANRILRGQAGFGAAGAQPAVAQVGNLPYRRLAVGKRLKLAVPADYQSAIRQTASLRYDFSLDRAEGPDTLVPC